MELLTASDFVVTASLALLLSILVAKLVSMAMASDHNTHEPVITLQQERLTVQKPRSERRVKFIDPIQVSTNVETEQNRVREEQDQDDEDDEENKVESNFFELDSVTLEDIAVEFDVSKVGLLRKEHVAEEEEEITENNEEESEEQRKTECVEDCNEQNKTEEITFEASSVKESENQGKTEDYMEQRKKDEISMETSGLKEIEQQKQIEEFAFEEKGIKESEEQRETENIEDFREQGKTEETTMNPFDEKERNDDDDCNIVVDDDDDDWEGIERSDLEKLFMMATEFVVGSDGDGLESDLQMELYGLHKIATEGPCRESQPMPLKINARAKWNAWQKLGNMSPDVAMEQYIGLVSDKVPGWMKDSSSAGLSEYEQKGSEVSESFAHDLNTSLSHQQIIINERELEQESAVKDHCTVKETDLENSAEK